MKVLSALMVHGMAHHSNIAGKKSEFGFQTIISKHMTARFEIIVCHKVEYTFGKIVWLKGQYQGLAERNGIATSFSYTRQIEKYSVEVRSLSIYDELTGVASNG